MKRPLILIIMLFFLAAGTVSAQKKQPTAQSLNDEIARYEEEIRRNETLLKKIRNDKKLTQQELKMVQSRINSRKKLVSSLNSRIALLEQEIGDKSKSIGDLREETEKLKKEYGEMIYAAYKNHKLNNSAAFIFAANDFGDMTRRMNYMRRYNNMRERKMAEIDSVSATLSAEIRVLNMRKQELDKSKSDSSRELSTLQKDEKTHKSNTAKLAGEEKKVSGTIKQKENEKRKAQQQLQKIIEQEARKNKTKKRTAEEEKELARLSGEFDKNQGKLPSPIRDGVVIDRFGTHKHPTQPNLTITNKGVNIAGEKGASVRCVFNGVVAQVTFIKGLNNCVLVRHGNYFTVYSNLAAVTVSPNDTVTTAQTIGTLPATNDNNDYYLHFEIWQNTTYLNPEKWLSQ